MLNQNKKLIDDREFKEFLDAYLACALWSSVGEGNEGEITDSHAITDMTSRALEYLTAKCLVFWFENRCYIDAEPEPPTCTDCSSPAAMAGHDYWLTSAGHGAGFWDGDWPKYGELLTRASGDESINLFANELGRVDIA